jgi:hypothetical protein
MINKRGWRYPESFRQTAIERFKCCENIEWLAKELGVPRQTLYRWHEESQRTASEANQYRRSPASGSAGIGANHSRTDRAGTLFTENRVALVTVGDGCV